MNNVTDFSSSSSRLPAAQQSPNNAPSQCPHTHLGESASCPVAGLPGSDTTEMSSLPAEVRLLPERPRCLPEQRTGNAMKLRPVAQWSQHCAGPQWPMVAPLPAIRTRDSWRTGPPNELPLSALACASAMQTHVIVASQRQSGSHTAALGPSSKGPAPPHDLPHALTISTLLSGSATEACSSLLIAARRPRPLFNALARFRLKDQAGGHPLYSSLSSPFAGEEQSQQAARLVSSAGDGVLAVASGRPGMHCGQHALSAL